MVSTGFIPTTMDPMIDGTANSERKLIFDQLFRQDVDMAIVPGLATEWDLVDELTWELKLRPDVKFHNGDPFTSADVKFTVDRILDPATKSTIPSAWLPVVKEVQVVDELTVRILTTVPWPAMPDLVQFLGIAPAKYFQEVGAEEFAANPIGTGPYKFVEWVKDSHLTLKANDEWWNGAPAIKDVTFRYAIEPTTRVASLLAGEVDIVQKLSPVDAKQVEATDGLVVAATRAMNQNIIGMNIFVPPLDDVRVRQALNYAVDWDTIIEKVLNGYAYRSSSTLNPLNLGYDPDVKPYPYDPDKARQMLAEAGYPDGFETTLDGTVGRYNQDKEVSLAIIADLAKVGVRVQYTGEEYTIFFPRLYAFDPDCKSSADGCNAKKSTIRGLWFFGCNGPADPDLCQQIHLSSLRRGIYYNTPRTDAMLDEQRTTIDPKARALILKEHNALMREEAPWIFSYDDATIYGHKQGLNFVPRPDEFLDVSAMSW